MNDSISQFLGWPKWRSHCKDHWWVMSVNNVRIWLPIISVKRVGQSIYYSDSNCFGRPLIAYPIWLSCFPPTIIHILLHYLSLDCSHYHPSMMMAMAGLDSLGVHTAVAVYQNNGHACTLLTVTWLKTVLSAVTAVTASHRSCAQITTVYWKHVQWVVNVNWLSVTFYCHIQWSQHRSNIRR